VDNPEAALDSAVVEDIRSCGGFYFSGGSQSRISRVFRPQGEDTPALEAMKERWAQGVVVAGSSAGAAIMSDPMIAGGSSEGALRAGVRGGEDGEGVRLDPGLGFLDDALVDQHFLARGRWARLFVAVLSGQGQRLGFGIDENTALVVEGDSARVVGASGVLVVDASDASPEEGGNGGYGIRLLLLGSGDGLSFRGLRERVTSDKAVLEATERSFENPDADLFARWTFLHVMDEFARSRDERLTFLQEGHFLELRKAPGFEVRAWEGEGVQGLPRGLFLGPITASVWRDDQR
jgi:cyanophycinase